MQPLIIGLAGLRQVGKSRVANHLVASHGFQKVHPFSGGKAACRAYYAHLGASEETAWRMTDGDLKDTPSPYLPNREPSRTFMERFGKFMGVEMGPDWTIGTELRIATGRPGGNRLVVESVVYEDHVIREAGGMLWMIERSGRMPTPGLETDAYTMRMTCDLTIMNDAETLGPLHDTIDALMENMDLALEDETEMTPF